MTNIERQALEAIKKGDFEEAQQLLAGKQRRLTLTRRISAQNKTPYAFSLYAKVICEHLGITLDEYPCYVMADISVEGVVTLTKGGV